MGLLIFCQVILDLAFIATATLLFIERSKSKTMEDPRMSRGLQLLTSKIAIIQDLMDRSEQTSKQLTQLIDGKSQDIQERLEEAEAQVLKMKKVTEKSKEVTKVFESRVPHEEIIEKQTTAKYILAAKLAHQGHTADEIAKQVDIPRGELELIVKVNRGRLLVEDKLQKEPEDLFEAAPTAALPAYEEAARTLAPKTEEPVAQSKSFMAPVINSANKEAQVRPVVFKKISLNDSDLLK